MTILSKDMMTHMKLRLTAMMIGGVAASSSLFGAGPDGPEETVLQPDVAIYRIDGLSPGKSIATRRFVFTKNRQDYTLSEPKK